MGYDVDGQQIAADANGYLTDPEDWSEDVARAIAAAENIELTGRHWDLIKYLREEFFENHGNQPNTRAIMKAMAEAWGGDVKQGDLYALFPMDPSKQGGRIAGLPESRRKGGY